METQGLTKLAEGKTKIIYADPDDPQNRVLITSKDDITAGDGAKHNILTGKAALATRTTCNCFELFRLKHFPLIITHFRERVDEQTFRALKVRMIPVELVARRIATGSYLKRNPEVEEGLNFQKLEMEFFLKDDSRHDPLMIVDPVAEQIHLFNAKLPLKEGYLGKGDPDLAALIVSHLGTMTRLLYQSFRILEKAWAEQNVTLVDLKIECGIRTTRSEGEQIVIADVIDNDSWRIWPKGQKTLMVDKQVYRDLPESTPEALRDVLAKYKWVADATDKFIA